MKTSLRKTLGLTFICLLTQLSVFAQQEQAIANASLDQIDAIRVKNNAKPLIRNAKLDSAAALQARWCAETGILRHTHESGRLRGVEDRIKHVKYRYQTWGENILCFTADEEESVDALTAELVQIWVDSPGHYANMRSKGFKETGFAVVWDAEREVLYACQVFATPAPKKR